MLMSRAYPCCCAPVHVPDRRSLGEGNSRSSPSGPLTPPFSGCTNPDAINYNPQAGQDDGSCIVAEDGPPAPEGGQELQGFISKARSIVLRGRNASLGGGQGFRRTVTYLTLGDAGKLHSTMIPGPSAPALHRVERITTTFHPPFDPSWICRPSPTCFPGTSRGMTPSPAPTPEQVGSYLESKVYKVILMALITSSSVLFVSRTEQASVDLHPRSRQGTRTGAALRGTSGVVSTASRSLRGSLNRPSSAQRRRRSPDS